MGIGSSVTCVTESFSTAAPKPIETASRTGSCQAGGSFKKIPPVPGDKKSDYEAGKPVPPAECQASCECTGNRGCYFSDLPFKTNKTTLQPYNCGKSHGEVRIEHISDHSLIYMQCTILHLLAFLCFCVCALAKTTKLAGVCVFVQVCAAHDDKGGPLNQSNPSN